jgi:hypothetical protein
MDELMAEVAVGVLESVGVYVGFQAGWVGDTLMGRTQEIGSPKANTDSRVIKAFFIFNTPSQVENSGYFKTRSFVTNRPLGVTTTT